MVETEDSLKEWSDEIRDSIRRYTERIFDINDVIIKNAIVGSKILSIDIEPIDEECCAVVITTDGVQFVEGVEKSNSLFMVNPLKFKVKY